MRRGHGDSYRRFWWALAAGIVVATVLAVVVQALPSESALARGLELRPGEFCSLSKESYYRAHGYTCHLGPDGRNRLYSVGRSGPSKPQSPPSHVHHGPSVAFHRRVRKRGCRLRDHRRLPDRGCTPGAYFRGASTGMICRPGYAGRVRHVPEAMKRAVYREYGIRRHSASTYEIDHLVPLELGGSNARANLFPEPARPKPGFHQKDSLENWAHEQVCSGQRALRTTQRLMARNWLALYNLAF